MYDIFYKYIIMPSHCIAKFTEPWGGILLLRYLSHAAALKYCICYTKPPRQNGEDNFDVVELDVVWQLLFDRSEATYI